MTPGGGLSGTAGLHRKRYRPMPDCGIHATGWTISLEGLESFGGDLRRSEQRGW